MRRLQVRMRAADHYTHESDPARRGNKYFDQRSVRRQSLRPKRQRQWRRFAKNIHTRPSTFRPATKVCPPAVTGTCNPRPELDILSRTSPPPRRRRRFTYLRDEAQPMAAAGFGGRRFLDADVPIREPDAAVH